MRARACNDGGAGGCPGNATETVDCLKAACPGFLFWLYCPFVLTPILLQRVFLTGNNGVHGLNVQPRVVWGPRFEHVLAVTQISEEIRLVLVTPPRQKIVLQPHVKVTPRYMKKPNFKGNITVEI